MNGPIKSERERLEHRSKWLERSLVLAGAVVVAGLIGESRALSAYLVTIGVFAEVVLGIFITKAAERMQELANAAVATANERAAKAEQAAAEANLARVRIEEKFKWRVLDLEARHELIFALLPYTGFRIDVFAFSKTIEVLVLADMLNNACRTAGCNCKLWVAASDRLKIPSAEGVTLAFAADATPEENETMPFLNVAIATVLQRSKIGHSIAYGGFRKTDPVDSLPSPAPSVSPWDANDVAPYRIQVEEKYLLDHNWPVTPPQAVTVPSGDP